MTLEYKVKIISYPTFEDGYIDGIIEVLRDENGVDRALRFLCHHDHENGKCKIYIPLGEENNEGGSGERKITWVVKDEVLTISPSIQIKGGCNCHYHITENKVV